MDNSIAQAVKENVLTLDAEARVFQFGARVQEGAEIPDDCPYEFLVLLRRPATTDMTRRIDLKLNVVEWAAGAKLKTIYFSQLEWTAPEMEQDPFRKMIETTGVEL